MAVSQAQIEKIVALAKAYGATRLILFGSAAEMPTEAKDIDLACENGSFMRLPRNLKKNWKLTWISCR